MTPTLRNYILRNIGPSALRLELVNRLENLCTLTGTPMSPKLHRWVEDTFGLEMVRVIEGYSSFTAPVLSPYTLDIVDRVIPKNYQGNDTNLMFKQLFDVSCAPPPPTCGKYLWSSTITNFDGPGSPTILTALKDWTNDGGLTTYYDLIIDDLGWNPPAGYYNPNTNAYPQIHSFAFADYLSEKLKVWFISGAQPSGWQGTEVTSSNTENIVFEGGTVCADEYWDLCCWVYGDTSFGSINAVQWLVYSNIGTNINSSFNTYGDSFLFQNNLQNMIDVTVTDSIATVTVIGSDTFIQLTNVNKAIFDTNSFIIDSNLNQWFFTECTP